MRVIKERLELDGIPVILARPEAARGVVLVFHGALASKEQTARALGSLAEAGLLCVFPDAPNHGERASGPPLAGQDMKRFVEHLYLTAWRGAHEAPRLLQALEARLGQTADWVGAVGFSMGGFVVHLLIAHGLVPLSAAVALASSGHPLKPPPDYTPTHPETQALAAALPLTRPEAYPPTPLLHIHGAEDPVVPLESMRATLDALRPAYRSHPGRLAYSVLEGVGHEMHPAMARLARAWLEAYR
ncbi:alpha/beta hydrolase [Marinithermus hydrothermalis]|uniref:Phospholipase/Carboxylesterase n=1 Tax=Marinithermus hydrothermalis (strain DSM 14884 / JCM 11576 / T1) TaxID=869210 RepID=F2NQ80_MARHT|nr:dienelactone hydrolase family protein [Marinithermus hydrothermalis]AEB11391.1 phospholipase/Carboxylesterase [Marinithermus hydrothermalis DSM 14884]